MRIVEPITACRDGAIAAVRGLSFTNVQRLLRIAGVRKSGGR
jgi:hypothetical protein